MGTCKKKVDTELETYFPGWFGTDLEYLENLRQWYLVKIEAVEDPASEGRLLKTVQEYFLKISAPMCFNPYDEKSIIVLGDREFEEMCIAMEDNGVRNVKTSTVFEFYSKIKYLEGKAHKMKSHAHK